MEIPEWTKKIEYGITNDSYLLKTNEVLRISSYKKNKMIDRNNESKILEIMKNKKNLTVDIVEFGFNKSKNFILKTKYLPFSYNLIQQKLTKNKIKKIFDVLTKFQNIDVKNKGIKTFNHKIFINNFKKFIKTPLINLVTYEIEINKIFKKYKPKKLCLSHNDMVPGNFLFDDENNKVYIIDFEYSSINDSLYDVASFISETIVSEENKKTRLELENYWISLFKLTDEEKETVKKWVFFQNVAYSFWANAMYDLTKEKIFLKILEEKYHQAKKMY